MGGSTLTVTSQPTSCPFLYIDVGSNDGLQIEKLFEPALYASAPVQAIFARHFPANRMLVCAVAIEPNPAHSARLERLRQRYYPRLRVVHAAASTKHGSATLWLNQGYLASRFPFPFGLRPERIAEGVLTGDAILGELDDAAVSAGRQSCASVRQRCGR